MFDKLAEVEQKFVQLEGRLGDPDLANNPDEFRRLSREHSSLIEVVAEYKKYKQLKKEIESNKELIFDAEFSSIAKEELKTLEPALLEVEAKLQVLLLPQDPNDGKNIILELRAGAGGEEAGLFVAALYRAYQRYAERQGWKVEVLSSNPTGMGGLREIISQIEGNRVYAKLKFEGGVHRVQRVPETEAQGRVHTSTITVAVLPEAEEVDVTINPAELRIDVFRSGGAGGQGVNTTDSAVRITHLPTNTVVVCQDERSQLKNKAKAMKILRSRILEVAQEKAAKEHSDARRSMVGTGDRSERIRTYNFPQSRMTDHRIGLTLHQLPEIMEGKLEPVIDALTNHHQIEALKAQGLHSQ
ncbi:MAG: peptide chain release factor 1 [Xanthomonadaceae bacterium]|nr:peptide chain release factor 1 [Xanthomonadaceae bacterium]